MIQVTTGEVEASRDASLFHPMVQKDGVIERFALSKAGLSLWLYFVKSFLSGDLAPIKA